MAYNDHTFTAVNQHGTWKIKLFYDSALGTEESITWPTRQTIVSIGERPRKSEQKPGLAELDRTKLYIRDDHSTYAAGLWHLIFNAAIEPEILITLDEGAGDKFWAYGVAFPGDVGTKELYRVNNTKWVRAQEVELSSKLSRLHDVTVDEITARALEYEHACGDGRSYYINGAVRLIDFLESFLIEAYGNTYNEDDIIFPDPSIYPDMKLGVSSVWFVGWSSIYLPTSQMDDGTGSRTNYFGGTHNSDGTHSKVHEGGFPSLCSLFTDAFDLFFATCENFGLLPTLEYDLTGEKFVIQMLSRRQSFTDTITFLHEPIESDFQLSQDFYVRGVQASFYGDGSKGTFISLRSGRNINNLPPPAGPLPDRIPSPLPLPEYDHSEFDITLQTLWDCQVIPQNTGDKSVYLIRHQESVDNVDLIYAAVRFPGYIYAPTGNYYLFTNETPHGTINSALCLLLFNHFSYPKITMFKQTYPGIKASNGSTTSFLHVAIGKRISLDGSYYRIINATPNPKESTTYIEALKIL